MNALLAENGEAALPKLQSAGEECLLLRPGALRFSEDASAATVASENAVRAFYNRCDPVDAAWAAARLCAEPIAPLTVPLRISAEGFGSVPKTYLGSRNDRTLPWAFQQKMCTAAGAELIELDGDHSPFLSVADEFVDRLLRTV